MEATTVHWGCIGIMEIAELRMFSGGLGNLKP